MGHRRLSHLSVTVTISFGGLLLMPIERTYASATVMTPGCVGMIGDGFQLKQAVDSASHNGTDDVIMLAAGCTYVIPSTLNVGPDIGGTSGLPHSLEIRGAEGNASTIDAQARFRAFHVQHKTTLTLEWVRVVHGSAVGTPVFATQGGGLLNFGMVDIAHSTFEDNYAENAGGALRNHGTITLAHSTIDGNESRGRGGGIDNNGSLTIDHSQISDNVAARLDGGGIMNFLHGQTTVTDSIISGNSASYRGGGVFNAANLYLLDSAVVDNQAPSGGGIHNQKELATEAGATTVDHSVIEGNDASEAGGGIANVRSAWPTPSTTIVIESSIIGNHSQGDGGALFNSGRLVLDETSVSKNVARDRGGGVFTSDHAEFTLATLSANTAARGGGIFAAAPEGDPSVVVVAQSTLSLNSADFGGGIHGGRVTLDSSTLSSNRALRDGGGIWGDPRGLVSATNSTLSGNQALTGRGGAIYAALIGMGKVDVASSTIVFNRAAKGGGIFRDGPGGVVRFGNTIVALNIAASPVTRNCHGQLNPGVKNLSDTNQCLPAAAGFTSVFLAGSLGPLADDDGPTQVHALLAGSPAINSGTGCPAVDQRGHPRDVCDIGSFEK